MSKEYKKSLKSHINITSRKKIKTSRDKSITKKLKNSEEKKQDMKIPDDSKLIEIADTHKWNFIKGPVSITEHYSKKYNKHIYIFGDYHSIETKCRKESTPGNSISISSFLGILPYLTNPDGTPKLLDYFFEFDYKSRTFNPKLEGEYRGYGKEIYDMYENCLQIEKDVCKYKNIRFHYSDIRSIPILFNFLLYYYYLLEILHKNVNNAQQYYELIDWVELNQLTKDPMKYLESTKTKTKIHKQYSKLQYPELEKEIENFYKSIIIDLFRQYLHEQFITSTKTILELDNDLKNIEKRLEKSIEITTKVLLMGISRLMDLYLVSRMFRKFKNIKGRFSEPPTNIIVYVGEQHAENYRRFLDYLGFSKVSSESKNENKDFQCLDVTKFKQPFFSEYNLEPMKVYDN
jgi:hypothetical protein